MERDVYIALSEMDAITETPFQILPPNLTFSENVQAYFGVRVE